MVSPLSLLPYRWATIVWLFLMAVCLTITGWLLCRWYPPFQDQTWLLMIGMVLFAPAITSLAMGQKGTLMLLLFAATFLLLFRGRRFSAGLVFGLVAVKPQLALAIGLTMLLKREFHFVSGCLITITALLLASFLIEPQWMSDYLQLVLKLGEYVAISGYQLHDSHSLWAALKNLVPTQMSWAVLPLLILSSLGVLTLVGQGLDWTRPLEPQSEHFSGQFSILVLATVLISPHCYTYDLTILLLPLALIIIGNYGPTKVSEDGTTTSLEPLDSKQMEPYSGVARKLALALFVVSGLLPSINLKSGIPVGTMVILALLVELCWPTRLPQSTLHHR
jgi:hypothetical protein